MPPPTTLPALGTHALTLGSYIEIEAPEIVNDTASTRWTFDKWSVYNEEADTWYNTTNRNHTVTLNANKTAYAIYTPQYLFTVITAYDVPNIWGGSWHENTSSMWFDEGHTVYAGVMKNNPNDWMLIDTYARAYFINWTGDATGKTYYSGYFWTSDPITMDGPKTAIAEWVVKYKLWTDPDSEYEPWGPGGSYYDPDERGWYEDCTNVDLTAPSSTNENPGVWRWRFDRWEVERWNGTAWEMSTYTTENITVHLGPGTRATAYFYVQYYLNVGDTPSYVDSGVETQSGWYDYCSNVTVTAPAIVPHPTDSGIRYVLERWWLSGYGSVYDTSRTIHIEHGTTVGKTLYAVYLTEYYLDVNDDIGGLSGVSSQSGWFAPGAVVPLGAPDVVPVDSTSRYVFVEWIKDPGHYVAVTNTTTITMSGPRNATAYYKKQYKLVKHAAPQPPMEDLLGGFPNEYWFDENTLQWIGATTGPISDGFFNWVFDYWTVNGVPQALGSNWVQVNVTGPVTMYANYHAYPAFFITPQMVLVEAPAACSYFEVNVTAANLVDLYAVDFQVFWDNRLLDLVDVDVEVNEIWGNYFIAKNEINNSYSATQGMYWFAATSLDGAPDDPYGFNGTHKIVKLRFHIIYDPCWVPPYYRESDLDLVIHELADSNADPITTYDSHDGYYRIDAIKPIVEMRPSYVEAHCKDYQFTVEIWIVNATKLHDWYTLIHFDTYHLDIIGVEIDTTFLTGPYEVFWYIKSDAGGYVEIRIQQQQPGETLAYGEGRLATLTFKVNQTVIWDTSNPFLHSYITFAALELSVKCPTLATIPKWAIIRHECEYRYLPIPGDVNSDCVVNVLDLQLVASVYMKNPVYGIYDLNKDWKVDLLDLVLVAINFGRDSL
jgi:hypothetical protein